MELHKLSSNVNKSAGLLIRRIIFGLCLLAGVSVLAIIISYTIRDNSKQVQLYSSQIDNTMSEKLRLSILLRQGRLPGWLMRTIMRM